MKKIKKLITVLLALSLVLTPAAFSGATDIVPPSETAAPSPAPSVLEGFITDMKTNSRVDKMVPYVYRTGTESDMAGLNTYMLNIVTTKDSIGNQGTLIAPIVLPEDGALLLATQSNIPDSAYPSAYLYSDAACTKTVTLSYSTGLSGLLKKGTYYFKVSTRDYLETPSSTYQMAVGLGFVPGGNKTLKNNTWTVATTKDSSTANYYKITISKNATIKVDLESDYGAYVTLCDSKKKALSDECYKSSSDEKSVYFAASKGTYYLKVKSSPTVFRIKSAATGAVNSTGSSKAKATAAKVDGKKITGFLGAKDSTSKNQWIKFTNPKNQKISISIDSKLSSGALMFEIYGTHGSSSTKKISPYAPSGALAYYTYGAGYSGKTLAKGTYYIKVSKDTAKTSASYSVQILNE